MDTISASDLSNLTPEEILELYTYRIAELSALIESNAYMLHHVEKSKEVDPKQIERIKRLIDLTKAMISTNRAVREHLNL